MSVKTYAFLSNNVVFAIYDVDDSTYFAQKWKAAFASNPTGMEITSFPEAQEGWVWNGNKFNPPAEVIDNVS